MGEILAKLRQEIADSPLAAATLAFAIGAGAVGAFYLRDSQRSSSSKAFGKVECPADQEVVAVWIDAEKKSDDGDALITKGVGSVAEYRKTLAKQQSYTVHVGCDSLPGGNWRFKDYARDFAESGVAATFICGPSKDPAVIARYLDHGVCILK
ncbi:MAG TPA: hypothetical protein VLG37_03220 [Candidatus Saccharimonadales bacterium]|nr:hypothetical protein [Candidatus Saccharimonadales bacterium]